MNRRRGELRAVIGLGASLGDRLGSLRLATRLIAVSPGLELIRCSHLYLTPALGPARGPFLNGAVGVRTVLAPAELLTLCKQIEQRVGRRVSATWADRAVDLDILLMEGVVVQEPSLRVPHPGLAERDFAWIPAVEVAGDLRHPVLDGMLGELPGPTRRGMVRIRQMLGGPGAGHLAPRAAPQ